MEIKEYTKQYFEDIYNVIHQTIEEIYPKYYPRSAVDFFHHHHSRAHIEENLPKEYTAIILEN
ncbi:MAG: GNAT family N-acetyltransferase, partial [Bacteroidales bacterium]|nr:GNAT family N-acetyltransferase [Bacteroidales bacterium]